MSSAIPIVSRQRLANIQAEVVSILIVQQRLQRSLIAEKRRRPKKFGPANQDDRADFREHGEFLKYAIEKLSDGVHQKEFLVSVTIKKNAKANHLYSRYEH